MPDLLGRKVGPGEGPERLDRTAETSEARAARREQREPGGVVRRDHLQVREGVGSASQVARRFPQLGLLPEERRQVHRRIDGGDARGDEVCERLGIAARLEQVVQPAEGEGTARVHGEAGPEPLLGLRLPAKIGEARPRFLEQLGAERSLGQGDEPIAGPRHLLGASGATRCLEERDDRGQAVRIPRDDPRQDLGGLLVSPRLEQGPPVGHFEREGRFARRLGEAQAQGFGAAGRVRRGSALEGHRRDERPAGGRSHAPQ